MAGGVESELTSDEMGWDGIRGDGMGLHGVGSEGMGLDGIGCHGTRWKGGMRWDRRDRGGRLGGLAIFAGGHHY